MEYKRGGKRQGSGRKSAYNEPTKAVRVPESRILEIKDYLKSTTKVDEVINVHRIDPETHVQIPFASERIAAGFPSPAQDYVDKTLDLNELLISNEVSTFIVEVNSLSMMNAGIDVGDKLIVDRALNAINNDIVIALIDNDFTVKRLIITNDETYLQAENPEFSDIHLNDGQQLIIWGVVTNIIKQLKKRK